MVTKQKPPIKEANVVLLLSRYKYTNNSNKYMKIIKDWSPVVALVAIFLLLMNLRGCDPSKPKPVVIPEQARTDSFRTVIKYQDSVRVKEVLKWRTMTQITDSVKCYEVLVPFIAQCDTVIKYDSILITSLKGQVSNDSVIIFKQGLMLKADSIHIVKLDKKVKRNRRLALFFGAIVAGGVGVKLIP